MATDATGTPTPLGIPTYNINVDAPSGNGNAAQMNFIDTLIQARATLASPTFTGVPLAPTPATADNTTKIATTAFVKAQGYLASSPSTGSGAVVLATAPSIAAATFTGDLTISAHNIVTDTVTGTQIATGATQKIGFFGATPVVQPTVNTDRNLGVAGSQGAVFTDTTFTGGIGTTAYTVGGILHALKSLGLIAP